VQVCGEGCIFGEEMLFPKAIQSLCFSIRATDHCYVSACLIQWSLH
jgi:hypothetical protein